MKKCIMAGAVLLALAVAMAWAIPAPAHGSRPPEPTAHAFFPFCIDWHDAKKRATPSRPQCSRRGLRRRWPHLAGRGGRAAEDARRRGLKLYQITMTVDLTPGKPAYDPRFKEVLALMKGRHVQFDLLINGMKPSDPAGDARAVEILREMSDLARDSGSQLLLYPHVAQLDRTDRGRGPRRREGRSSQRRRDVQSLPLAAGE